jgi:hypothetical protein
MMINLLIVCFDFSILAGLAKGNPHVELESELKIAEFLQRSIGRLNSVALKS